MTRFAARCSKVKYTHLLRSTALLLEIAWEALECVEIESRVAVVLWFERREDALTCRRTLVREGVAIGREGSFANFP
jgi:hypothetical protein